MKHTIVAKELVRIARMLDRAERRKAGRFPPKAIDYNKLSDADGFWEWPVAEANRAAAIRLNANGDMGNLIFYLNMAASRWEELQKRKKKASLSFGKEYEIIPLVQDCLKVRDIVYRKVRADKTFGGYLISVELADKNDAKNNAIFVWNCCLKAAQQIAKKYNQEIVGYRQIKSFPKTVGISINFTNK